MSHIVATNGGLVNSTVQVDKVEGAILVDQLKSLDWAGRQAQFHSTAEATLLRKVRQYIAVLLRIR
jgi:mRNA-degrading endonuclease toxin of MazEF toxin-antitoxin module